MLGLLAGLPRSNYWTLAEHELQHLFAAPVIQPAATQGTGCAGWCGRSDIRHAPWPATTNDKPPKTMKVTNYGWSTSEASPLTAQKGG
jgi:hypothetical protein